MRREAQYIGLRENMRLRANRIIAVTLNVFDYDPQALIYSMEKASISLESYIEKENII